MTPGGIVGQTNAAIIADQFKRLKFGDRFFFSHQTESPVFRREAFQRTLSAVICDNAPIKRQSLSVIKLPVEAMKQGPLASCPEIQGQGKPASESPTLDFAALALEIVSSLEGKQSNGVKPMIGENKPGLDTNKGLTECTWDDECKPKQNQGKTDNKTLLLCVNKRCAYVRGRCVAEEDCGVAGSSCQQNYCQVDQSKLVQQRCTTCKIGQTCKMEGGQAVCQSN